MMMYLYDNNKDMIFIFLIVVSPFWVLWRHQL